MPINTEFTRALGLRAPIVCAAMQWVSVPPLAAAAAASGALGILTALSQPSPEALREAIKETRRLLDGRPGKFVRTLLNLQQEGNN
jgi:NAD(P)H-dependent flavin oxidoreductase YrpB (nitropropane dioxygenase family)